MKQRVTYKTKDGTIKEQMFDDFNEFADLIQDAAIDYYSGDRPEMDVETIYDSMTKKEKVTENERTGSEFLTE
jgi:hypothetical protein